MIITACTIEGLRRACAQIGETSVTVATRSGVITFDFSKAPIVSIKPLRFESQPTGQELAAILPAAANHK